MMPTTKKWIVLTAFLLASASQLAAQKYMVYRKKQLFLGVYGGVNFSFPHVTDRYSVLVPTQESDGDYEKDYGKKTENFAGQFGVYFAYGMTRQLSLVVQPGYYTYRFHYLTNYSWSDTVEQMNFAQEMKHVQNISYFTLPVLLKWDIAKTRFTPFLQLGVYTDFRHRGNKSIYYDHTIDEKVDKETADGSTAGVDITDHIRKFNVGLVGGAGFSYYAKYFTVGLECNYRYGFLPIVNDRNRYSDMTGFTAQYLDVFDQLKLSNVNVQFKIIFPVNSLFDLNILRRSKY